MKNKLIITRRDQANSGTAAMICAFWFSQILACNLVSNSLLFSLPYVIGGLSVAVFAVFFFMRLLYPGRLPAVLGAGSLAALMTFLWLIVHGGYRYEQVAFLMVFSTVSAFAGILLDTERCWRWIIETVAQKLRRTVKTHFPVNGAKPH